MGGKAKSSPCEELTAYYLQLAGRYLPVTAMVYSRESLLLDAWRRERAKGGCQVWLLDPAGELVSSAGLAERLEAAAGAGTRTLWLGVGPADGWSDEARELAYSLCSLGRVTLPHELARAVVAEQIYRALTIRAGHPYHTGH